MSTDSPKTFSLTLSPGVILGGLLTILPVIGGGAYVGITQYNRAVSAIEEVEGIGELRKEVEALKLENKNLKDRLINSMESAIKAQEKAADALALSRETRAISDGNSREVQASLSSIRMELKSITDGLRAEMNALKRATVNPLGR